GAKKLDKSQEQLVGRRGVREGTSPPSTGVGAIHAPLGGLRGQSPSPSPSATSITTVPSSPSAYWRRWRRDPSKGFEYMGGAQEAAAARARRRARSKMESGSRSVGLFSLVADMGRNRRARPKSVILLPFVSDSSSTYKESGSGDEVPANIVKFSHLLAIKSRELIRNTMVILLWILGRIVL
ncbi:hypothetical protein GW17_00053025, partial [Ensete ventricosum]